MHQKVLERDPRDPAAPPAPDTGGWYHPMLCYAAASAGGAADTDRRRPG